MSEAQFPIVYKLMLSKHKVRVLSKFVYIMYDQIIRLFKSVSLEFALKAPYFALPYQARIYRCFISLH